jgi:mannose-1-phosphate guanylyltransferase/mannose-6-phosphate isomerase
MRRIGAGVKVAVDAAKAGRILAFGVHPRSPHTGYGYIRSGAALENIPGAHAVETFREKPHAVMAAKWLGEGGWLWNSGMFLFRAKDVLEEITAFAPVSGAGTAAAMAVAERDGDFLRPDKKSFLVLPSLPFDIAVMEKTTRGAVIPVDLDWTDLGDWDAIQSVLPVNGACKTLVGDVMAFDTRTAVLRSDGPLVAAIGDSVVVVATDDAVLVLSRETSQEVRQVVDRLRREGRTEADLHRTVHRPWGSYRSLALNDRFQVKEIVVRPGVARVTIGDEERVVHETESVYVPVGTPHRLANSGKIPLRLIEVQTGSYLGEDDIVRFEDSYGRT